MEPVIARFPRKVPRYPETILARTPICVHLSYNRDGNLVIPIYGPLLSAL